MVVVDAADRMRQSRLDPEILHLLYKYHAIPATLVLNKVPSSPTV